MSGIIKERAAFTYYGQKFRVTVCRGGNWSIAKWFTCDGLTAWADVKPGNALKAAAERAIGHIL